MKQQIFVKLLLYLSLYAGRNDLSFDAIWIN